MSALEKAYASNASAIIDTLDIRYAGATDAIRLVRGNREFYGRVIGTARKFEAAAFEFALPEKSTDGQQNLNIAISNVNRLAYSKLAAAVNRLRREKEQKAIVIYRTFLQAKNTLVQNSLIDPAQSFTFTIVNASSNQAQVNITASYTPIADIAFPRKRYFIDQYPGLKYL